jgi:exopolysaccharide biosynthesis polyprenyl glycosylphosphotransferase
VRLSETQRLLELEIPSRANATGIGRFFFPLVFAAVDSGALILAATAPHLLPGYAEEQGWEGFLPGTLFLHPLVFWLVSLGALHLFGFYDRLRTILRNSEIGDLYTALAVSTVLTMAITLMVKGYSPPPGAHIATWVLAPVAVVSGRSLLRWLRRQTLPLSTGAVPVLIFGQGEEAGRLIQRIESLPELDLLPVRASGGEGRSGLDELCGFVQRLGIRYVLITPSGQDKELVAETVDYCYEHGLRVAWLQATSDLPLAVSSLHTWDGTPVIHLSEPIGQRVYEGAKRALDLACVLVALPLLLTVLAAFSLAVRLDSPGPAILRQRRVGRGSRIFDMYKFRSMRAASDEIPEELRHQNEATGPMFKIRKDPRITAVGRFLRRTSIDEMPQFLNVLRGEMSLVGPRPPLPREIPGYDELQRRRLMVKPGITGLWQVSGRSSLTFEEMLKLDVKYIQKRSLLLDVTILLKTIPCVLNGKGAY